MLVLLSFFGFAVIYFAPGDISSLYIQPTMSEEQIEAVREKWARGTADKKILRKHVLKNTLLPVITLVGMNLSSVVGGSFIIETVFGWPGVGTYAMTAIKNRDYPAIMAYTMLIGAVLVAGNLIADLLYAVVDPRIRQGISAEHWLGTDEYGRDYFTRALYGGQVSIVVGLMTMVVAIGIGTLIGTCVVLLAKRDTCHKSRDNDIKAEGLCLCVKESGSK